MAQDFYLIQGGYEEPQTATDISWIDWDSKNDQEFGIEAKKAPFALEFEAGTWRDPEVLANGSKLTAYTKSRLERSHLMIFDAFAPATWEDQVATLGVFATRIDQLPAVSAELKGLYEFAFPGFFEYVQVKSLWSERHTAPYRFGPYFLVNLLERRDGWDLSKMDVYEATRGVSSKIHTTNVSKAIVNPGKVQNCPIWRDSTTGHVVCNERFRSVTSQVSLHGWHFYPLRSK